ncbi:ZIP family metal transporter [Candidatus Woesearchaeota archaeon]|nr:ZIP family metal transporter [Candidatus Woesearchaeota archaeon]
MNKIFYAILLVTAFFQVIGSFIGSICHRKFKKRQNILIIIETLLMTIISIELIYFGITTEPMSYLGVIAGLGALTLLSWFIPHKHSDKLSRISLLVFIAMCLHELPEGIAFASSYLFNKNIGIATAILMALHNIPEGIIVTLPYMMKNKLKQGFLAVVITQLLYIIGAVFTFIFLLKYSPKIHAFMMSFAAGAMLYVIVEEVSLIKR